MMKSKLYMNKCSNSADSVYDGNEGKKNPDYPRITFKTQIGFPFRGSFLPNWFISEDSFGFKIDMMFGIEYKAWEEELHFALCSTNMYRVSTVCVILL